MKKVISKEKSSFVLGRGIIIIVILIPASLSFILGYLVGKNITQETPEMKQYQDLQANTMQPVKAHSQQQVQPQTSESSANRGLQFMGPQTKAIKESQSQKPTPTVYTVQVGAFKNVVDADALKKRFEKKGYKTTMALSKSKKEGELYKIWVGKFSNRKDAEDLSSKIKKTEGLQAFVAVKKEENIRQP